jgi:putative ABC transport system permease protein
MALGATGADVMRLVLKPVVALLAAGLALGVAGAWLAVPLFASVLFGVTALESTSFGAVALVLVVTGGTAAYLPARRAARVDPNRALRQL